MTKPRIYQPKFSVPPPRGSSNEEDHAEEDLFDMNELVALAAQDKQRNGFGPYSQRDHTTLKYQSLLRHFTSLSMKRYNFVLVRGWTPPCRSHPHEIPN